MEDLIKRAADGGGEPALEAVFDRLRGVELYCNVAFGEDGLQRMGTVEISPEFSAVVFYTNRTHPALSPSYGGLVWERILEMLLKMDGGPGVVIQSLGTGWIAIDNAKARHILGRQRH